VFFYAGAVTGADATMAQGSDGHEKTLFVSVDQPRQNIPATKDSPCIGNSDLAPDVPFIFLLRLFSA